MGSRAEELALFVVYWSPLTCLSDDPVNYKDQLGLDFLRVVPTVWDETVVLDGAVGEHIVMARRSGQRWFIGGVTGDKPYNFRLPLYFLPKGEYIAHIYADPGDTNASYESLTQTSRKVTAADTIDLYMRLAGGVAIELEPIAVGRFVPHACALTETDCVKYFLAVANCMIGDLGIPGCLSERRPPCGIEDDRVGLKLGAA